MPEYIGINELSRMTGYNPEYLRQLCRKGEGPEHYYLGRKIVCTRQAAEDWLKGRLVDPKDKK